jgi:hypothetical protein
MDTAAAFASRVFLAAFLAVALKTATSGPDNVAVGFDVRQFNRPNAVVLGKTLTCRRHVILWPIPAAYVLPVHVLAGLQLALGPDPFVPLIVRVAGRVAVGDVV